MSRADLFVVCKNPDCGAEVSPYITECPYCGARLRKRAPKLDRGRPRERRPSRMAAAVARAPAPGRDPRDPRATSPPYVTGAIVAATCLVWILTRGGYLDAPDLVVGGPLHGEWWRVLTAPFTYFYTTGVLADRDRHLPVRDAARRSPSSAGCSSAATAAWSSRPSSCSAGPAGPGRRALLDPNAVVAGANGAALALLCAWAVPDLLAAPAGRGLRRRPAGGRAPSRSCSWPCRSRGPRPTRSPAGSACSSGTSLGLGSCASARAADLRRGSRAPGASYWTLIGAGRAGVAGVRRPRPGPGPRSAPAGGGTAASRPPEVIASETSQRRASATSAAKRVKVSA